MGTSILVIVGTCSLLGLLVLLRAGQLRRSIYRYDVRGDQRYEFPKLRSSRVTGQLINGSLALPLHPSAGDVVLLELRIQSTTMGHWFEPYVEIESSRRRLRQPFERAGAGLRYLELSCVGLLGEASLRLTPHYLGIPDQTVILHYLQSGTDLDHQRILVLGAHPDDAEIAAFGVYADRDAYVVTVTAGEAGAPGPFERFGGANSHREKGRNRAWNSVVVPMLGGLSIDRTANLGYFDGTLQAMMLHPDTPVRSVVTDADWLDVFGRFNDPNLLLPRRNRSATWKNLVADLEQLIQTIKPEILVTPYPLLDAHPDHKLSTVALVAALKNLNWRQGSLLLYTNHLCSSDRYPFGEAGDLVSLPPGITGVYFDGIVSQSLDETLQARKHMALDAMIDLRDNVRTDSLPGLGTHLVRTLKSALTGARTDYFQQAVRANELFFEVRVSTLYEPGVTQRIFGDCVAI